MHRHVQLQRGFTLVEIIIVMVLISTLSVIGLRLLSDNVKTSATVTRNASGADQVRIALERLAREVRQAQRTSGSYQVSVLQTGAMTFVRSDPDGTTTTVNITSSATDVNLAYGTATAQSLIHVDSPSTLSLSLAYYDSAVDTSGNAISTTDPTVLAFVDMTLATRDASTGQSITQRQRVMLRNQ